jgi:hypothetical protein
MKKSKSKVEKKTKLNKTRNIEKKKQQQIFCIKKFLKNYLIFLTLHSKLRNLHMVGGAKGIQHLNKQATTTQGEK